MRHAALGREITRFHGLTLGPRPSGGRIVGEVLIIDSFGNIVTNIECASLKGLKVDQRILVKIGNEGLRIPFVRTYNEVEKGGRWHLWGAAACWKSALTKAAWRGG